MASDPITWKNMRPVSIADELMAYAKYSGGAGDALRGVGTSIDDLLQRKSTRDTESFLAGADDLPTAEARNAALQQAREGFNLINVGDARKGLRTTELHDFARQQEERQVQAAKLDQDRFGLTQDRFDFEKDKYDDLETTRELQLENLERTSVEEERAVDHFDTVQDSLGVVASVQNDPRTWFDNTTGNAISGDEAVRRQLETSIAQNKAAGISEADLAPLIDQYNVILDSDTLADEQGVYITQTDIDKAFPTTKKVAYTIAGKTRLENAVFRRLQSKYKSKTASTTAKLKEMAKTAVSSSAYAEKFDNPLIDADAAMERATTKQETNVMRIVKGERGVKTANVVDEAATTAKKNKRIVSTYLRQLKKLQTRNAKDVPAFNQRHRNSALDAIDLKLGLVSTTPTKFENTDKESEYFQTYEDPTLEKTQAIIDKPWDQLTVDDLLRYDRHLMKQVKTGYGLKNLTDVEFDRIKSRNQDIQGGSISANFTAARKRIGQRVSIQDTIGQEGVKQAVAGERATTVQKTETATMHALVEDKGVGPGIRPTYVKWLKDNSYPVPEAHNIDNATRRLQTVLDKNLPDTATDAEKADIILKFLRGNHAGVSKAGNDEIIIDWDEDGQIRTGMNIYPWRDSDQEIVDIPDSGNDKLFRMLMEKGASKKYYGKKDWQSLVNKQIVEDNNNKIKQATAELLKYGVSRKDDDYTDSNYKSVIKDIGGFATLAPKSSADIIKMLKDEIAKAEKAITKVGK